MSTLAYLKSFFKDKDVASVTPTSRFCVRTVCEPVDFSDDLTIVEYGAGAGVFAEYLLERMTPKSQLIMFETNNILFEKLNKIDDPRVRCVNRSVEYVGDVLEEKLVGNVDFIISGIPFSFLKKKVKKSIMRQSRNILKPGGSFLAYQTSGHLKKPLQETFGNVSTQWEWRNIPPMTVYRSEKR